MGFSRRFYRAAALCSAVFAATTLMLFSWPPPLDAWLYPALQTSARLLIGLLLWQNPGDAVGANA